MLNIKHRLFGLVGILCMSVLLSGCMTEDDMSKQIHNMYTENEKEMILDAISRFGDEKVSAIKKVMPDYVKYESIRAVILENYLNKLEN